MKDLTGKRFGRLTALQLAPKKNSDHSNSWLCRCDCGKSHLTNTSALMSGRVRSCGCLQRDTVTANNGGKHPDWKGVGDIPGAFWYRIQNNAKKRGLAIEVNLQNIWDLFEKQNRQCALSGLPLKFGKRSGDALATASLDRIDSSQGYIPGNLQWVHKRLQQMKSDMSQQEFLMWCNTVSRATQRSSKPVPE